MTAFLYTMGIAFALIAFKVNTPLVFIVAAIFYLQNDPAATILSKHFSSFTWYAYFTVVLMAFGIFLFSRGNELLMVSAVVCFVAAVFTMLASKNAFMGGWFSVTYNTWFGVTHGLTIAPLLLYAGLQLR